MVVVVVLLLAWVGSARLRTMAPGLGIAELADLGSRGHRGGQRYAQRLEYRDGEGRHVKVDYDGEVGEGLRIHHLEDEERLERLSSSGAGRVSLRFEEVAHARVFQERLQKKYIFSCPPRWHDGIWQPAVLARVLAVDGDEEGELVANVTKVEFTDIFRNLEVKARVEFAKRDLQVIDHRQVQGRGQKKTKASSPAEKEKLLKTTTEERRRLLMEATTRPVGDSFLPTTTTTMMMMMLTTGPQSDSFRRRLGIFDGIKDFFTKSVPKFFEGARETIVDFAVEAGRSIVDAAKGFVDVVVDVATDPWGAVRDLWDAAVAPVEFLVTGGYEGASEVTLDLVDVNVNGWSLELLLDLDEPLKTAITGTCEECWVYAGLGVNLEVSLKDYQLRNLAVYADGQVETVLRTTIKATQSIEFDRQKTIATWKSRVFFFAIGPVPVTLQAIVPVNLGLGLEAGVSLEARSEFVVKARVALGFRYDPAAGFREIADVDTTFAGPGLEIVDAGSGFAAVRLYLLPMPLAKFNFFGGPEIGLKTTLEATARVDVHTCFDIALKLRVEGLVGAKIESFLGIDATFPTLVFFRQELPLLSSDTSACNADAHVVDDAAPRCLDYFGDCQGALSSGQATCAADFCATCGLRARTCDATCGLCGFECALTEDLAVAVNDFNLARLDWNARYTLRSRQLGGLLYAGGDDATSLVRVGDDVRGDATHWTFEDLGDGKVAIRRSSGGSYLDARDWEAAAQGRCRGQEARLHDAALEADPLATTALQWTVEDLADGLVALRSVRLDGYLDSWSALEFPVRVTKPSQGDPRSALWFQWTLAEAACWEEEASSQEEDLLPPASPYVVAFDTTVYAIRSPAGYLDSRGTFGEPVFVKDIDPASATYWQWTFRDLGSSKVAIESVHLGGFLDAGDWGPDCRGQDVVVSDAADPAAATNYHWTLEDNNGGLAIESVRLGAYLGVPATAEEPLRVAAATSTKNPGAVAESVLDQLRARRDTIAKAALLRSDGDPSSIYTVDGLLSAAELMLNEGVGDAKLWAGDGDATYALVNLAAFLAQSMHETIQYDACDENNWSDPNNFPDLDYAYPATAACGQANQDYSAYACSPEENAWANGIDGQGDLDCPVDPAMQIRASTHAWWSGAPAPLFCAPTSTYATTGYWDYHCDCQFDTANFPNGCVEYAGQTEGCWNHDVVADNDITGGADPTFQPRTDVEGCCWWGRGVIQTTGVCNYGKLNMYVGQRAARRGVASRFSDIDFCRQPEAICANSKYPELKWVAGFFYWAERSKPTRPMAGPITKL